MTDHQIMQKLQDFTVFTVRKCDVTAAHVNLVNKLSGA